jgi:hypothetical protein
MGPRNLILPLFLLINLNLLSQTQDTIAKPRLIFSLPLIDLPFQSDAAKTAGGDLTPGSFFRGYANPGMHLSLDLSTDLYTGVHYGLSRLFHDEKRDKWGFGRNFLYFFTIGTADFILTYAPTGEGWEHEEYHRAVMSRFQVSSFDDMNRFPIGSELISVSHILDADLIRFKAESPADFVRMQSAGIEGEFLLIDKLQRNNFFYNQRIPNGVLYWIGAVNSMMYVQTCSIPESVDPMTDEMNEKETRIEVRDFTGMDFTGWTRDLFRPEEAYSTRGIHPSGNGIDRYTKTTDLTPDELSYLRRQGKLQWINLISPMMFGFKSIQLNKAGLYGNFQMRDYLTSFGNDISLTVFLMQNEYRFSATAHCYSNYVGSFPGIEGRLYDYSMPAGRRTLLISPGILIGLQPHNQVFTSKKAEFLGAAECKFELKCRGFFHPYAEFSAKTAGWIAGNEFLDGNLSFRLGITARLFPKPSR